MWVFLSVQKLLCLHTAGPRGAQSVALYRVFIYLLLSLLLQYQHNATASLQCTGPFKATFHKVFFICSFLKYNLIINGLLNQL